MKFYLGNFDHFQNPKEKDFCQIGQNLRENRVLWHIPSMSFHISLKECALMQ